MNGCSQVEIGPSARADLLAGYDFFESQQAGLGEYFTDSLLADMEGLLIYAGVHAQVQGGFFRALSSRFPYAIYYRLTRETASVMAVLDTRQNPDRIFKKLSAAF